MIHPVKSPVSNEGLANASTVMSVQLVVTVPAAAEVDVAVAVAVLVA